MKRVIAVRRTVELLRLTWREVFVLTALSVLYAVFEGFGIGMLLPLLSYIQDPAAATSLGNKDTTWKLIDQLMAALHLPVNLFTLLCLAFIPIVLRLVVYFINAWYAAVVQKRVAVRMRVQGFSAIAHGDLSFLVSEGEGNLVSLLTNQVSRGVSAVFWFVQFVSSALLIAVYVAVLIWASWSLALLAVAAIGLISVLVRQRVSISRRLGGEVAQLANEFTSTISERIRGLRLIKMRAQEDAETDRVSNVVVRSESAQARMSVEKAGTEVTVEPVLMLALFLIIYFGVTYLHVSLAGLGVFLFVLLRLNQKTKDVNVGRQMLSQTIDALVYVDAATKRALNSRKIASGDVEFPGLHESIEFSNVSFGYVDADGERTEVLDEVSLVIPRGSMTALVGKSGAGKSTLVDLLPRLRDIDSGDLLFDGIDVRKLELRSLRRAIGFMTQDAILFNDTVRGNLVYGLERVPGDDEIHTALVDSFSLGFVEELSHGIETNIGDHGARLSGGQRQRLALARALLQRPDILVLDEPTSALDSESEQYIQQALDQLRGKTTLIVIAHRLSTVQRADQIIVLDGGKIIERGTHDSLRVDNGAYQRLFDMQIHA